MQLPRYVIWLTLVLIWYLTEASVTETLSRKHSFSGRVQRVLAARKNHQAVRSQKLRYLDRVLPSLKTEITAVQVTNDDRSVSQSKGINQHIIGGSLAEQSKFQYMAHIMIDSSFLCGGALISSMWVITAAHCTKGFTKFSITFGAEDLSLAEEKGRVVMTMAYKVEHPGYKDDTLLNDLALIKLNNNLTLNNGFVAAVRLPRKTATSLTPDGVKLIICGFGLTNEAVDGGAASEQLKQLVMTVISHDACTSFYGTYVTINNLCCEVKVSGERHSTCSGDSGGPLVRVENDGVKTLVGIVSYGSAQGCKSGPSVFTRVINYLDWISSVTKIPNRQLG